METSAKPLVSVLKETMDDEVSDECSFGMFVVKSSIAAGVGFFTL